ncbi:MAG TPA: hypothetical protein VGK19_21360 [Capsulimonadaceae bacterium]|jgi:hypothetical protein
MTNITINKPSANADTLDVNAEPDVLAAVGANPTAQAVAEAAEEASADGVKTVEERARLWDMAAPLIEPLLEKFGSVENVAAVAGRHADEVQRLREEREVAAIADKLRREVTDGVLSPEAFDEKLRYEVLANRIFQNEIDNALCAAREQFPHMDEELVRHVAKHPRAVHTIAEHTHHRTRKLVADAERRAIAEYVASKASPATQPEPAQGASPVTAGASYKPRGSFSRWLGGRTL